MRVIGLVIAILLIIYLIGAIPFHFMEGFHMDGTSMIVAIVAVVMITGLLKEAMNRRNDKSASKKDLDEIKQHMSQIEADIADIKDQIADYIIKTN